MKTEEKPPVASASPEKEWSEAAVFIGWQKMRAGKIFPLYNITLVGHPAYGSTVTDKGLHKLHLEIPETPRR